MSSTRREAYVRRAQPEEAEALNEMITRSKGYWGYDPPFIEAYRALLRLSPEVIERHPVYCARVGDTIAGMLHVMNEGHAEFELSHPILRKATWYKMELQGTPGQGDQASGAMTEEDALLLCMRGSEHGC